MPTDLNDTLPPPPPPSVPLEQLEDLQHKVKVLHKEMRSTNVRHRFKPRVHQRCCEEMAAIEAKLNELCG